LFSVKWPDLDLAPKLGRGAGKTGFAVVSGPLARIFGLTPMLFERKKDEDFQEMPVKWRIIP
jgi:hypothetical protein